MLIKVNRGILYAIFAAVLFGASTPFSKLLIGNISPLMLAGLLYAGSGIGLGIYLTLEKLGTSKQQGEAQLTKKELPWLAGAVVAGGVIAPALLMLGLSRTPASSASLLLNLEGVFTALLAWGVFKENCDRRIFTGMLLIIAAGMVLTLREIRDATFPTGSLLVVAACLFWGIDNNLTRKVSASNPVHIACIKGLVAGAANIGLAQFSGASLPFPLLIVQAALVGFLGYGISLVLFILAMRHLGTARSGAYFSLSPFAGATIALLITHETPDSFFCMAALLIMGGIWLHLSEKHEHDHTHTFLAHAHKHIHDEHHQHSHDFPWDGTEPHSHFHEHEPLTHCHAHYPDIHHRHRH